LIPIFDEEDLEVKKLSRNAAVLQTLQSFMIKVILGMTRKQHINMENRYFDLIDISCLMSMER